MGRKGGCKELKTAAEKKSERQRSSEIESSFKLARTSVKEALGKKHRTLSLSLSLSCALSRSPLSLDLTN